MFLLGPDKQNDNRSLIRKCLEMVSEETNSEFNLQKSMVFVRNKDSRNLLENRSEPHKTALETNRKSI